MKEKLKKLWSELSYTPKHAEVSESKMTSCLITCVVSIVICLVCLGATSWAWFQGSARTGVTEIKSGSLTFEYELKQTYSAYSFTSLAGEDLPATQAYTLANGKSVEIDMSGVPTAVTKTGTVLDVITEPRVAEGVVPLTNRGEDYTFLDNGSSCLVLNAGTHVLTLRIREGSSAYGYVELVYVPAALSGTASTSTTGVSEGTETGEDQDQNQSQTNAEWGVGAYGTQLRIQSDEFVDGTYTVTINVATDNSRIYIGSSWESRPAIQAALLRLFGRQSEPEEPVATVGETEFVESLCTSAELQAQYDLAYAEYVARYELAYAEAVMQLALDYSDDLAEELEAARVAYEAAYADFAAAQEALSAAQVAYDNAKSSLDVATADSAAQDDLTAAQAAFDEAASALTDAQAYYAAKLEAEQQAAAAREETGNAYAKAVAAANEAVANYDAAAKALAAIQPGTTDTELEEEPAVLEDDTNPINPADEETEDTGSSDSTEAFAPASDSTQPEQEEPGTVTGDEGVNE